MRLRVDDFSCNRVTVMLRLPQNKDMNNYEASVFSSLHVIRYQCSILLFDKH